MGHVLPGTAKVTDRVSRSDRLGASGMNYVKMLFGLPSQRRLARAALQVDHIRHWEKEFSGFSDGELKQRGLQLRGRARGGGALDRLLAEAFGLGAVGAVRTSHLRPLGLQVAGGGATRPTAPAGMGERGGA